MDALARTGAVYAPGGMSDEAYAEGCRKVIGARFTPSDEWKGTMEANGRSV
ncbi:MAG: hypothetical protein R3D78_04610 [Paracoccaceae bacterium]